MGTRKINRVYLYIAFALIMLIMSWESNLASAALMNSTIPEQSIRIRILANSDSVEDQWMKKEIRDAITANVNTWSLAGEHIENARNEVNNHLPELNELVRSLLAKYDFTYGYQVELRKVYFPAKIFGHITYPAGEYEALRVTLGEGQGQNWWCVLFPPLCFGSAIKATSADKMDSEKDANKVDKVVGAEKVAKGELLDNSSKSNKTDNEQGGSGDTSKSSENSAVERVYQAPVQDGDDVKVKFFVWEKTKKLGGFVKGLFS